MASRFKEVKEIKRYSINGKTYTFDVNYEEMTNCGKMWLGVCRENGKEAFLDSCGVQFDREHRQPAHEVDYHDYSPLGYGFGLWGAQGSMKIVDLLPHGARYYL